MGLTFGKDSPNITSMELNTEPFVPDQDEDDAGLPGVIPCSEQEVLEELYELDGFREYQREQERFYPDFDLPE